MKWFKTIKIRLVECREFEITPDVRELLEGTTASTGLAEASVYSRELALSDACLLSLGTKPPMYSANPGFLG
jgi:hypothetical protein